MAKQEVFKIECPHCDYLIKRKRLTEGNCRRCGAHYLIRGSHASFGKPKRLPKQEKKPT